MAKIIDDKDIKQQKAKSLQVAMVMRGRKTGEFAKELGVGAPQLSIWRKFGTYNDRTMGVLLEKLGYTLVEFFNLGKKEEEKNG
jgi:hypothetical protein